MRIKQWKAIEQWEAVEIKVVLGFKKASSSNRKNEIQKEIKGIERGKSKMVDYAPGMRTIIRDEEWIVKK